MVTLEGAIRLAVNSCDERLATLRAQELCVSEMAEYGEVLAAEPEPGRA